MTSTTSTPKPGRDQLPSPSLLNDAGHREHEDINASPDSTDFTKEFNLSPNAGLRSSEGEPFASIVEVASESNTPERALTPPASGSPGRASYFPGDRHRLPAGSPTRRFGAHIIESVPSTSQSTKRPLEESVDSDDEVEDVPVYEGSTTPSGSPPKRTRTTPPSPRTPTRRSSCRISRTPSPALLPLTIAPANTSPAAAAALLAFETPTVTQTPATPPVAAPTASEPEASGPKSPSPALDEPFADAPSTPPSTPASRKRAFVTIDHPCDPYEYQDDPNVFETPKQPRPTRPRKLRRPSPSPAAAVAGPSDPSPARRSTRPPRRRRELSPDPRAYNERMLALAVATLCSPPRNPGVRPAPAAPTSPAPTPPAPTPLEDAPAPPRSDVADAGSPPPLPAPPAAPRAPSLGPGLLPSRWSRARRGSTGHAPPFSIILASEGAFQRAYDVSGDVFQHIVNFLGQRAGKTACAEGAAPPKSREGRRSARS